MTSKKGALAPFSIELIKEIKALDILGLLDLISEIQNIILEKEKDEELNKIRYKLKS